MIWKKIAADFLRRAVGAGHRVAGQPGHGFRNQHPLQLAGRLQLSLDGALPLRCLAHRAIDGKDNRRKEQRIRYHHRRKAVAVQMEERFAQLIAKGPVRKTHALVEGVPQLGNQGVDGGRNGQEPPRRVQPAAQHNGDQHQWIELHHRRNDGENAVGGLRPRSKEWAAPVAHYQEAVDYEGSDVQNCQDARQARQLRRAIQPEEIEQQIPQPDILNANHGLQPAHRQVVGNREPQLLQNQRRRMGKAVSHHGEQNALLAVPEPGEHAEDGDQPVEHIEPEAELLAPHPRVIVLHLSRGNRLRTADEQRHADAANLRRIEGGQRRLPHAQRQHAVPRRAQPEDLLRRRKKIDGMRWQRTSPPHKLSVPVNLVSVVNLRNQQGEVRVRSRRWCQAQMLPVPGKARIRRMPLRAPCGIGRELLPAVLSCRVVGSGISPLAVVADVKLPGTVERRSALAECVDA